MLVARVETASAARVAQVVGLVAVVWTAEWAGGRERAAVPPEAVVAPMVAEA